MNKTVKIISAVLLVILLVAVSTQCFATGTPSSIIDSIDEKTEGVTVDSEGMTDIAGRVIKIIRYAAVIIGVVLISVFGIKFMIGSAEEKAEYKKSFIPLIIGIIVVFGATYIAQLLFNTFKL